MFNQGWMRTEFGYEGSARRFNYELGKHVAVYELSRRTYPGGGYVWNVNKYNGEKVVLLGGWATLKEAKIAADMDYDLVPKILSDEEQGWKNATGFKA